MKENDTVRIILPGEGKLVANRRELARNMNLFNQIAKDIGKRPGEASGSIYPYTRLSFDAVATEFTLSNDPQNDSQEDS